MKKYILSCLFAALFTCSFAQEEKNFKEFEPWYTGPLLTPSANNLEPGFSNIQPYLYYTDTYPDSGSTLHTIEQSNFVQYGLLDFLDVTFFFKMLNNERDHHHCFGYGDTSLSFGIQLLRQKEHTPTPSIRLTIGETFPTGKYRNLDPDKLSVDSMGGGAFRTKISINFSKIVYWMRYHPMSLRLFLPVYFQSLVQVKEFNAYGGGYNTYGKVRPSYVFSPFFSFEVSLTQRWVYAMDFSYEYDSKTTFSGERGTNIDGTVASCESDASQIFAIAPAIEYNLNTDFGFIAGVWLSLATKNASDFVSYIFSFTYTF